MLNSVFKKWLSVLLITFGTLIGIGITENLPTNCGKSIQTGISARIMGGKGATLGQWPWMAALFFWESPKKIEYELCGGSLIADEWVLTAAHCFDTFDLKLVTVRLGDLDLNNRVPDGAHPIDMDCKNIFKYPGYNISILYLNDIALLQLKEKVKFSKFISPVRLPFNAKFQIDKFYETKKPFVMGWGFQDELKKILTTHLQYVQIDVENLDVCRKKYATKGININKEVICAGNNKKDACLGDSGGPLILLDENIYYAVGVITFGPKCGAKNTLPSIYTKVATYLSWIRYITGMSM